MKKILLTGSSGFLGGYILDFLENEDYELVKVGRSVKSDIVIDLSINRLSKVEVDYVIHVAGKAHVIAKSAEVKEEFFNVNYVGTNNLLRGLDVTKLQSIIFISTVAVYGKETGELIDEKSPLNGNTPYALSKIQAEQSIIDFGITNNIKTVVLRLPLVSGKNPLGNLGAIIKAIKKGYYFRIGKGHAKKSIIAAADVANLIPELFDLNGIYNLTDTYHPMISEIDSIIAKKFNKKIKIIPIYLAKFIAKIGDIFYIFPFNSSKFDKLTKNLTFSNKKLFDEIKYRPLKGLSEIAKNLDN
ncbi:NAD-dependent epimerase/dehydratase family protein [Flavobacteriaceae bacterium]|nr:NAD-dependent epimerase/dehydratase family protein [Flavobacteriaceae bacterium]